jgi:uncharacterized protein (DUF1330 family)
MAFELSVGLLVTDQDKYSQYRAEMTPLLEAIGGRFRYDFSIARTLKSEADHDINRVFMIEFPDAVAKEKFFADPQYLAIRTRHFVPAVSQAVIIAEYDR